MNHSPADRSLIDLTPGEALHPNIKRLYEHWRNLAPDQPLPGRQHIDPLNFPDLLPGIWLLQVERDPLRFRYRLAGTDIVEVAGREVTGLYLEEAHPQIKNQPNILIRYINAAENGRPSRRKGNATLWQHRDFHLIENLLLPLARDGKTVDMILVYTQLFSD